MLLARKYKWGFLLWSSYRTQIYCVVHPITLCTKTAMGTQTPVGDYSLKRFTNRHLQSNTHWNPWIFVITIGWCHSPSEEAELDLDPEDNLWRHHVLAGCGWTVMMSCPESFGDIPLVVPWVLHQYTPGDKLKYPEHIKSNIIHTWRSTEVSEKENHQTWDDSTKNYNSWFNCFYLCEIESD